MIASPANPVRGIIFDLDGTLYHMKWYMQPLFFLRLFPKGLWLPRYMKVRSHFAGKDFGNREKLMEALSRGLANQSKTKPQRIIDWFEKSFYPGFIDMMPFFEDTRPNLEDLLRQLRNAGKRIAVLSDFSRIEERLRSLHIKPELFDTIVSSEEEGALKPSARPHVQIARTWGIPTGNILVVGDRDDTDGVAARACGMHFVHLSDKTRLPAGAHRWEEIRRWLGGL